MRPVLSFDREGSASDHGVTSVHGHVEEYLDELARVHENRPGPQRNVRHKLDVLAQRTSQQLCDLGDHRLHVKWLRPDDDAPCKRKEAMCEFGSPIDGSLNTGDV